MDSYKFVMFGLAVVFIIIQSLIINYLVKLENIGCECAMDWRRKYIIFFLLFSIVYAFATFLLEKEDLPLVQTMMVVLGVINVIVTLQYVHRLQKEKCTCSESIYREIMTVIAIFHAFMYTLMFIIIIFMMYFLATFARNMKGNMGNSKSISIKPLKNVVKKLRPKFQALF